MLGRPACPYLGLAPRLVHENMGASWSTGMDDEVAAFDWVGVERRGP